MKLRPSPKTVATLRVIASGVLLSSLTPWAMAQDPPPAVTAPVVRDAKVAGQDVPVPTRKKYVAPQYPAAAAAEGIRGIVILEITIGEDGRVQDARVTRSIPGLDEAALNAIRLWEYEVTKVAGKPVKVLLSQSITFAMRLPDLQREMGVPELKSGGAPPVPASLATPANASVAVTLGSQGEVQEAAVLDGDSVVSEALLRAVKSWRFLVTQGAPPASFTIRADWAPGPPPSLVLKAFDFRSGAASATSAPLVRADGAPTRATGATAPPPATAATAPPQAPAGAPVASPTSALETQKPAAPPTAPEGPQAPSPAVETEVLPARVAPPAKEEGVSNVADVTIGDNIPDLVKGRHPTWPPLARLGNITGEVVVRFSVDLAGKVTTHSTEGPEMLKEAAEQAVGTWLFRRTAIDRLHLIATFKFGADRSMARVERAP
ncbi:MAG: TonB family protein [Vicinamibacteria bacterium]|nr:TonB family protein [Vicinamibacteria bacterium]